MSMAIVEAREGFAKHPSTGLGDYIIYADCPFCKRKNTIYSAMPGATLCTHYKDHTMYKPTITFKEGD